MPATPDSHVSRAPRLNGQQIAIVSDLVYLAFTIPPNRQVVNDVERHGEAAQTPFLQLQDTL